MNEKAVGDKGTAKGDGRVEDRAKEVIIRPLVKEDLDELMEIEKVSFPTPWSKESYLAELENDFSFYIAACCRGHLVGYAGMWIIVDEGHVTNIAVHPDFRRRGLGAKLLEELIRAAAERDIKGVTLEVRPSNTPALRLYRKMGFVPNGIRKGYYTDSGEDAIVMWKYIV